MKQKLLNILLMSASVAMVAGCGEVEESSTVSESSQVEESSTASSSVEESTSSIEESSSSIEESDSSSSSEVVDEHPTIVELDHYIYVKGDTIERTNVKAFDVWSKDLEGYSQLVGSRFTISDFPEECPNGPVEIELAAGKKKGYVTVYYYESAEKAAELTEVLEGQTTNFKETRYIKNNKLVYTTNIFNDKLYVAKESVNVLLANYNTQLIDPVWTVNKAEAWSEGDTNTNMAVYDNTRYIVPHLVVDGVTYPNATYSPGRSENPVSTPLSNNSTLNNLEVYVDADGHIAYMGKITYDATEDVDITSDQGYWSYYKDYTKNPAFLFADDFDANDPVKKYHYEKAIPVGGFAFIAYTVGGSESYSGGKTCIASIYDAMTAQDGAVYYSDTYKLDYTVKSNGGEASEEEIAKETALLSALLTSVKDRTKYQVNLSSLADTYQTYAYYKVAADKSKDEAKINKGKEVLASIENQALPQFEAEPVLANYYDSLTQKLLAEWIAMFE